MQRWRSACTRRDHLATWTRICWHLTAESPQSHRMLFAIHLSFGVAGAPEPVANGGPPGASEDYAVLAQRLHEEGSSRHLDAHLLASATRALKERGVLEKQLRRAREVQRPFRPTCWPQRVHLAVPVRRACREGSCSCSVSWRASVIAAGRLSGAIGCWR